MPVHGHYYGWSVSEAIESKLRRRPLRTQAGDAAQTEQTDAAYAATEAEAMRQQLKALGYLD